ncbi:MAG: adenylate kinase [Spirochaetaceae bacterium]|nr:adenylate kinase [Spirochaetaceae bacterium]
MKIVLLGPPGAGKGTFAAQASKRLGLPHISTGDLFRAAIKNETSLGKKVKDILANGLLVPDELTIGLVKDRLLQPDAADGWILDGFPRTIPQAEALQEINPAELVLNLEVDDGLILQRLMGRRICRNCGKIYHMVTMPPKRDGICDACGGELYTRSDDQEDSIKTRLAAYREQTEPLVQWYGDRNLLIPLRGKGTPDSVYAAFEEVLRNR